ncbi:MAG: MtnX-like HAD-IB family phosphatase [SAR202 cluster bacterium]|nr:MtnX-like HAD-IB family phosphatase [SAR202 cluster bacterium]
MSRQLATNLYEHPEENPKLLIVQCDFDGTITMSNLGTAIKEAFGPENWKELEAEYEAGNLTAEQNNIRHFGLIDATQDDIEEFVKGDVVVRFMFDEFVHHCHGVGIRLVIVSSGLRAYIDTILDMLMFEHMDVHAAQAEFTPDGIQLSYVGPDGNTLEAGFKAAWTNHFKSEGHTVIYVGDGRSDLEAARQADHVIATRSLAEEMTRLGLPFHPFDNFEEVGVRVEEIRAELDAESS